MEATSKARYAIGIVALAAAALCPLPARAQQISSSIQDPSSDINTLASGTRALAQAMKPAMQNPFESPSSSTKRAATSDSESPETLLLQVDRKFTSSSAEYAFTAPPGFYSLDHRQANPADWNSSLTGTFTSYLNQNATTGLRMTSDLEMFGQRRQAGSTGDPGAQTFTMQWQASRVISTRLGSMEVAAGRYQEQLVSYPALANAPLIDLLQGYAASSAGFETTVAIPERNIGFSFRYGAERVGSTANKSHTTLLEFCWTW